MLRGLVIGRIGNAGHTAVVDEAKKRFAAHCDGSAELPADLRRAVSKRCICLGGAVVERWTRDRKVAGLTPGRGATKSTRSTQPSIPLGQVNRVPASMVGVRRGVFTFVRWQVTL